MIAARDEKMVCRKQHSSLAIAEDYAEADKSNRFRASATRGLSTAVVCRPSEIFVRSNRAEAPADAIRCWRRAFGHRETRRAVSRFHPTAPGGRCECFEKA